MRDRSIGVTALAFSAVMVALYSQYAAVALLLTGSVSNTAGSSLGPITVITGALFMGLTVAAYLVGYGFWTGKHWSWAGGMVVFVTLVAASFILSVISTNFTSLVLPSIGAIVAMTYLQRSPVRRELLDAETLEDVPVTMMGDRAEAKLAH